MKIGALLERIEQGGGGQALIHDQVSLSHGIKVVGHVGLADRQDLHKVQPHSIGVPVGEVFLKKNTLIDPPTAQSEGAITHEFTGLDPVITILGDEISADRIECREGTEIEEIGCRLSECDLQGSRIKRSHSDRREITALTICKILGSLH